MSVEEVKATIRRGIQVLGEAQATLASIHDQVVSAQSLAAATTQGTSHDTVGRGMARLDQADEVTERTLGHLRDGVSSAQAYLEVMG